MPLDTNGSNKAAWDALYASTAAPIWGEEPVGFLAGHLPDFSTLPPGDVLDAASGEGRNLPLLLAGGRPVLACDASAAALAKIPAAVLARVTTFTCDLAAIPRPDASCAFILACDIIETLPDPRPALREFARLLAPGGLLLANIPGGDDHIAGHDMSAAGEGWLYREKYYFRFYEPAEISALLHEVGLECRRLESCTWQEAAHPHFRPAPHEHRSRILLATRREA